MAACSLSFGQTSDLQAFANSVLVDAAGNDGDSFRVRVADGRELTVRLYFVDCPETSADSETEARRVRTQTAYFGLPRHADTVEFGRKAAAFTRERLARPFTLHTALATAPGRSAGGRVYGFVRTADGEDLGEALVSAGLARAFGVRRATPEGLHRDEAAARLADRELSAAMERNGIWSRSDPTRLVALRAEIRAEESFSKSVQADVAEAKSSSRAGPLDVNTASPAALATIPGIGPALAERIVAGRPFGKVEDLTDVSGIGPKLLERIRPHVTIVEQETP